MTTTTKSKTHVRTADDLHAREQRRLYPMPPPGVQTFNPRRLRRLAAKKARFLHWLKVRTERKREEQEFDRRLTERDNERRKKHAAESRGILSRVKAGIGRLLSRRGQ